jgi:ATP-binding cassette subfamily B (MDR/TAP) protein 1
MSFQLLTCNSQIRELQVATSQPLGFAVQYTVTTVAAMGLALYSAWDLTLITLATVPFGFYFLSWLSSRTQPAIRRQVEELSRASKIASNSILTIDTVKCFNGQEHELLKYGQVIKKAASWYLTQARVNAMQIAFIRLLILGMFVQAFWYGSHLVETGEKTAGQILTGFWACLMATQTFEQIMPQMIVLEKGRAAAATLKAVLDKLEMGRKAVEMVDGEAPAYCDGDIQVNDVSLPLRGSVISYEWHVAQFFVPFSAKRAYP